MAREKKAVHKVQMTEGKRNIIQMPCRSMTSSLPRTFRMPLKICLAAAWRSKCRKTASLPLNLRCLKSARKTFLISIRKLSPCMQKG